MKVKLKPCPFCGGEPWWSCYPTLAQIGCRPCGFNIHGHGPESERQTVDGVYWTEIYEAWNRRK